MTALVTERACELAARTRAAQGLGATIADPDALLRVSNVLARSLTRATNAPPVGDARAESKVA